MDEVVSGPWCWRALVLVGLGAGGPWCWWALVLVGPLSRLQMSLHCDFLFEKRGFLVIGARRSKCSAAMRCVSCRVGA